MTTLTRRGLVVPFDVPGTTSEGRITVAKGDLTWPEDPAWIKLLIEHDQAGPVAGHAIALEETDLGLFGVFAFPRGVSDVVEGIDLQLRDGLSAGIDFDQATKTRIRRAQGEAVRAVGRLREVSLASVPAFEAARMFAGREKS